MRRIALVLLLLGALLALPVGSAAALPRPVVIITAQLSGPTGTVTVHARLTGTPGALSGNGVGIHQTFGVEARFTLTGSLVGSALTLSGWVTQSSYAGLVGGPATLDANLATGAVAHTLTPASGPFTGVTLAFAGSGVIVTPG